MQQISLYDTTLRDGTQGEDVSFSAEDKIKIAKRLDSFGINIHRRRMARFESQGYGIFRARTQYEI
jgi:isopropylmalate/homocitrate/citramalate synthase